MLALADGPLEKLRGPGVGNFRAARIFLCSHFPCRDIFFGMQELFSGPLAVHKFFSTQFSFA